jgi:hypothetical protein
VNFGWDELNAPAPTSASSETQAAATTPASPDDPRSDLGEPTWQDPFEVEDNWPLYEDAHVRFGSRRPPDHDFAHHGELGRLDAHLAEIDDFY